MLRQNYLSERKPGFLGTLIGAIPVGLFEFRCDTGKLDIFAGMVFIKNFMSINFGF